jgi:5-methylcytosine-specific restriction endonuclease McrA
MKTKMSNAAPNVAEVWKQMEDILVPQLRLSVLDRSVYSHLLRHSRLEGKLRLRFSIQWLARAVRVSGGPAREAVRRLAALGALRLVVRAACPGRSVPAKSRPGRATIGVRRNSRTPDTQARALPLEDSDFLQTRALRQSIHARERSLCFYCLRRLTPSQKCLDHVVPRVRFGRNSYRNLVSSCVECNSQKSERPARDFLRGLYREQRLTTAELADRLRALDALAAGKPRSLTAPLCSGVLPGPVHSASRRQRVPVPPGGPANPFPRKGRPRKAPILAG